MAKLEGINAKGEPSFEAIVQHTFLMPFGYGVWKSNIVLQWEKSIRCRSRECCEVACTGGKHNSESSVETQIHAADKNDCPIQCQGHA